MPITDAVILWLLEGEVNQIVKNNNSHMYSEDDKIILSKKMEEIGELMKGLFNCLVF